ncbi:hypothetical protein [Desulfosporosinus sp. FKA]|uniref:hypothetical protein n=1 Tax=Desulfosporosinus sp. FKA TaxID=1969834 RepID=UPI000B4A3CFF|nr:hypothetical protein [Desulfosporosinus sp. FKA]
MEITGLNKYYYTDASSKKGECKNNSDTGINMAEVFKNEILNWKEKVGEKVNEDLKNDRENNIKMSEKQWRALLNKVDSAINAHRQPVKTDVNVHRSKPNDVNKQTQKHK